MAHDEARGVASAEAQSELYEVQEDLSGQPLYNKDIAPVPVSERTWNKWNFAALWVGMSVCIPTYMLAASLISAGMNWWQAILTVMLGNVIVLVPMVLNAHAGTKFGIPFPVYARSAFGLYGSNIPALMRALVACGWFGIQTWVGAAAVYGLHKIMTPGLVEWLDSFNSFLGVPFGPDTFLAITFGQFIALIAFWLVNMVFVWIGTESIRWLETLAAPFLIIIGLGMLWWAISEADGLGPILSEPSKFETAGAFWWAFILGLTGQVGYWATLSLNISDFTRFSKSQKDQMVGQAIGLPSTMTLFAFIGVAVTSATVIIFGQAIWDPVVLLQKFENKIVVAFALFALTVATVSTNIAANIVSPANDFSNVAPRYISFRIGGTIAGVIGLLIMPWKLLANPDVYIFTWLVGYSALLGPIAAVLICDYFIIRKRKIPVEDLYGPGRSVPAFNWIAIIALFVGILPNVPGFLDVFVDNNMDNEGIWAKLYSFAWFNGFAISFVVYWVLHTMIGSKKGNAG